MAPTITPEDKKTAFQIVVSIVLGGAFGFLVTLLWLSRQPPQQVVCPPCPACPPCPTCPLPK